MSAQQPDESFDPPGRAWLKRIGRVLEGPGSQPSYWLTRFWILRLLGLVYTVAFATAVLQLLPLIGEDGLLPATRYLQRVAEQSDGSWAAFWELPTVFWFDASDTALMTVSWIGLMLAIALMLGLGHPIQLLVLWALHMSILHVGQRWYSFGWETQLLETGFLAVFLCPWNDVRPFPRRSPPVLTTIILHRWLIVRIMLGAGLIKLRGDPCWSDLTCLDFHFETQPNPHPLSWWFHHLPAPVHRGGVAFNHFVEVFVPFLAFGPRRLRHFAGVTMILFQGSLIVSGNLAYLNWLTIVPAIACLDDGLLRRVTPAFLRPDLDEDERTATPGLRPRIVAWVLAAVIAWLSLPVVGNLLAQSQAMNRSFGRLHLVNTYGAFGSVGRKRIELVIEGTRAPDPGEDDWREYEFPCKPGDPSRRPCLITPYHLRLDWLIWFAGLDVEHDGQLRREAWVIHLVAKLLEGNEAVLGLLEHDPFDGRPPRTIRVVAYRYRFSEPGSDDWWVREFLGVVIRPVARDDEELQYTLQALGFRD